MKRILKAAGWLATLGAFFALMVIWASIDPQGFECATRYVTCVKVIK